MAVCVLPDENNYLLATVEPVDTCSGYVLISHTEYQLAAQTVDITPEEIGAVFAISFSWVVLLAFLSYKVRVGKNVVRQL